MILTKAHISHFKSIDDSGGVPVSSGVTVLVGQNEAGKTAFLQALNKARSVDEDAEYSITEDYPRKNVNEYRREHETTPAKVAELTYTLNPKEIKAINSAIEFDLFQTLEFFLTHTYDNKFTIFGLILDETKYVKHLISKAKLSSDTASVASKTKSIKELLQILSTIELNATETQFLTSLKARFKTEAHGWTSLLGLEVWQKYVQPNLPKFVYFDDYRLLPGKINLPALAQRVTANKGLRDTDRTILSLLRMAQVSVDELNQPEGYEDIKARLEGLSNSITDRIFKYWKQNQELDVEFDIRADATDQAPFNTGANLYIRIRNKRHRVTVPFSQRSKGFIWFFSFIVWFDSIKQQEAANAPLILLLDEPGLSLHALAQNDLLVYIDDLAKHHQVLYTTHSPFMVHSDRLHDVRLVADHKQRGTLVTDNISGSDPKTIFPLQAALGYTVAQNLFISKRNLLVEGPADLVYLQYFSTTLAALGRPSLRDDITIVPVGGLDKVATFIALLGANQLEIVVLHDFAGQVDPRIDSLVKAKIIRERLVLNYGMFRSESIVTSKKNKPDGLLANPLNTDVEDMLTVSTYLNLFNATFAVMLNGLVVNEADLLQGDRIVERISFYLKNNNIKLRPSNGFNHYAVANQLVTHPPKECDADTLNRFENLFKAVNDLFAA